PVPSAGGVTPTLEEVEAMVSLAQRSQVSTKRAALYLRVSTAQQEDGYSLDTQESAGRALGDERGEAVIGVYREVYSGIELWDRPRLTELRAAMRRREFEVLIVYAIDRLARD